jgi:hypothetical protein
MTTDMENELRDLLREKAGEAPVATPTAAPQQVLRRGRRRQAATILWSAAVALILIVGSVAGLQRILGDRPDPFQAGGYEVFERTATIEAFTVTSPSDWYLVNQWPLSMLIAVEGSGGAASSCVAVPGNDNQGCERTPGVQTSSPIPVPHGLPMLQLSNEDIGLEFIACGGELPSDMAVLYVALDYERAIAGIADPSIRPFPPEPGLPSEGDGPCGPGRYAHFTVNGEPFFSWIGVGSGVSDEDREIVETSYEKMSAIPEWTPAPPDVTTPGYVIAGGTSDNGNPWRLELRPGDTDVDLSLIAGSKRSGTGAFTVPAVPVEWTGTDPIFGAVTKAASGVEFRPGTENESYDLGGSPVPGTIVPVPQSLGSFDFDLFFIDPPAGYRYLGGQVVALGMDQAPTAAPPPTAGPRNDVVELSGTFEGQPWTVRFTGAFEDGSACLHVTIDEAYEHCPEGADFESWMDGPPSLESWLVPELYLSTGSVPTEVVEIRFVGDDDAIVPQQFRCEMGPLGWTYPDRKVCAIALPPEGSGIFEYLDSEGVVLFEEGMGWGIAGPQSNEYPWTNENTFITAAGSFQGAEWKLQVLFYRDGYRLTSDGNVLFEGRLRVGEPQLITLVHGSATEPPDTIVLVLTGTQAEDVAVVHDSGQRWAGRWIPGATANGEEARVWLIELPGRGSGAVFVDGVVRGEVSWP